MDCTKNIYLKQMIIVILIIFALVFKTLSLSSEETFKRDFYCLSSIY